MSWFYNPFFEACSLQKNWWSRLVVLTCCEGCPDAIIFEWILRQYLLTPSLSSCADIQTRSPCVIQNSRLSVGLIAGLLVDCHLGSVFDNIRCGLFVVKSTGNMFTRFLPETVNLIYLSIILGENQSHRLLTVNQSMLFTCREPHHRAAYFSDPHPVTSSIRNSINWKDHYLHLINTMPLLSFGLWAK